MNKDYYLGLDIGTESVGWALSDTTEKYELIKKQGKSLWGVRLFNAAKTAKERRVFRSNRRRLARKKYRLSLLEELFSPEILKVDDSFFHRLHETDKLPEDKKILLNPLLSKYSTVYHLRRKLLNPEYIPTIQELFFAVHHIIKKRGHFLFENDISQDSSDFEKHLKIIEEITGERIDSKELKTVFNEKISNSEKVEKLNKSKSPTRKTLLNGIFGLSINYKSLLETIKERRDEEEEVDKKSFKLSDSDIEEKINNFDIPILQELYSVYSLLIALKIKGDFDYISDAMINIYKVYKNDLRELKTLFKKYNKYNVYFRGTRKEPGYYTSLIGKYKSEDNPSDDYVCQKTKLEDFYKQLKKDLNELVLICEPNDKIIIDKIIDKINNNDYMLSISVSNHEKIPYQFHKKELIDILNNASKKYLFLLEKDSDNSSVKDKIISLLEFRVPYYVGPLNKPFDEQKKTFAWVERVYNEKITPWNFDKVVDKNKSSENFIKRMTNKCTYLKNEDVLPKQSLLFQKYMVLTSLNNLIINGKRNEDRGLKLKLYEGYLQKGILTKREIYSIVKEHFGQDVMIGREEKQEVEQKISLSSFKQLSGIGLDLKKDEDFNIGERIIFLHSIHENKKLVMEQIKREYKDKFTSEQLKIIKGLNFSKFSPFSKALLDGIYLTDKNTGEVRTIIKILEKEKYNFMEITSEKKYNFNEAIKKHYQKEKAHEGITYGDIEELYCSPAVKRSIWQTILLVKEIKKLTGNNPKKVFIEVTRENDKNKKGKQTKTRQKELQEILTSLENKELLQKLSTETDDRLKGRKLYLYYKQDGKDMYTGEPIKNLIDYDLDHIIPQSTGLKDDSLTNNLVLVSKESNQNIKKDIYPLPSTIRNNEKVRTLWEKLLKCKAITQEKYERLTRVQELTDEDKDRFVERQLVITNQSVKAVAELLKEYLPETEIVYSKAKYVSEFKDNADESKQIYKNRNVNDLHHAKDAYLNIVVGNVNNVYYTQKYYYLKNTSKNPNKLYSRVIENAWNPDVSYASVYRNVNQNDILVTTKVEETKGAFYDQTIYGKRSEKNRDNLTPRTMKEPYCNTQKYGGYDSVKGAYFCLIKTTIKNQTVNVLEQVPIMIAVQNDESKILEYFKKNSKYTEIEIVINKILIGSLVSWNGGLVFLNGRSNDSIILCNAVQWKPSLKTNKYIHFLNKVDEQKINVDESNGHIAGDTSEGSTQRQQNITREQNLELYQEIMAQLKKEIYFETRRTSNYQVLEKGMNTFVTLLLSEQVKILLELIKLLSISVEKANLLLIGGSKEVGGLQKSKYLTGTIKLIDKSITGFYEKTRTLN
ncbi:MAG: type II CRISPR RNA-guided endonuclease Cas9 [Bacillales bacterium]|jgi:CRISPR-associated endonuclease Csn1|nr:type II CRISPR RNA-guided endonuclease Cas9 [Bacillales bacterium]